MRTKKLTNNELITALINKMLEKYNVDMKYIKAHEEIEGKKWFEYYAFSREEEDKYAEWAKAFIKEQRPSWSKRTIEKEYAWFSLMWGLRVRQVEYCALCGQPTSYERGDNISVREYYVEGAGQLCKNCYEQVYNIQEK